MKLGIPILIVAASSLLVACAAKKSATEEKEAPKPPSGPTLIGRIASVPQDKRFVLIQSYGKWSAESGQILTTRGPDGRSANLKITGEKLAEFAAADVQSGEVQTGDAVYSHHSPKPVISPPAPEVSEIQRDPNSENVQKNN